MSFAPVLTSGALRATWTEIHGVTPLDRSITIVPASGPGELSPVVTMIQAYLQNVWTHALSHEVIIVNLAVTEVATGTTLGIPDPGIHGRQDGPPVPNTESVVVHLDSEYRSKHWNTRLYRRGTAASLVSGSLLTKSGRSAWALVAEATAALFLYPSMESYHQLCLVNTGVDILPEDDPFVAYLTPVAWIRVGGWIVKSPPG